jgi:predicted peroxiredoxin
MSVILFSTTFGSDDPTRATIPFVGALGAIEAGHQAQLGLLGEASYLIKDDIAEHIHGVGFSPLTELWPKVIEHEIPVYI